MNVKRFFALSVLAATCAFTFSGANAQSLRRDGGPAEIPPASFKANQYVDSKGCVYIRAGVDGNTNWVPRVSRSRKVVCGLSPSLGSGAAAAGTAVAATTNIAKPVEIGVNSTSPKSPAPSAATQTVRPARATVASVLAPKPVRTVASTAAAPRTRTTAAAPQVRRVNIPQPSGVRAPQRMTQTARVQAPSQQVRQPRVIRVAPQAQTTAPRRVAVQPRTASTQTCRGASAVSQRYIGGRGNPVRCGPQAGSLVTTRAGDVRGGTFRSANGQTLSAASVSPNARVVPRHVYEEQQASRVNSPTPKGYRQAWDDDRLNSKRAHQSLAGKAQTDLIWTQTVPRRLIVRSTGRDVTRSFPGLLYPYTSQAEQATALRQGAQIQRRVVSSKGTTTKRVVRQKTVVKQQTTRVATRSSAPRKPAQAAGKRFIQVGTFGVAGNAQNTAQRLQRMGLPVRIGKFSRGGKQMRIVLAGPFGSSAHTNGALTAVRNAGFRDAFARN